MRYIDTHSHPQFPQYNADRDVMLARMREVLVGTIAVGTSYETSKEAVELAGQHPDIWAAVGVHPNDLNKPFGDIEFAKLLNERVVAIGECGLDYFRSDKETDGKRQRENFEAHIVFAIEHDLPLMLHIRASKGTTDAHDEALDILKSAQARHGDRVRGNAHFFTGPLEIGTRYWNMGFTTAFPGVVTFAKDTHEVVRAAPLDLMLSETDAPYAAPEPHRGKRNEPSYVVRLVEAIADIRREDRETVRSALLRNAERVFRIRLQD